MKTPDSIGRYISLQVTLLIGLLVGLYSLSINAVYQWGTYDTTHYFLSYQADKVYIELEKSNEVVSGSNAEIQFFLDYADLPQKIKILFPRAQHLAGEMLVVEKKGLIFYLLPSLYPESTASSPHQFFYILHVYDEVADDYDVVVDIPELMLLLLFFTLVIATFLLRNIVWSIIKPIQGLQAWAAEIKPETKDSIDFYPDEFRFKELHFVADRLASSVENLKTYHRREKGFLRSLSHELRTPLAINRAALDLLQRTSNKRLAADELKLERMRRANNHMLATSECLLWLWMGRDISQNEEAINLADMVADAISVNRYLLQKKSVKVISSIENKLVLVTEKKLMQMVVENLIRNAFQYATSGIIGISVVNREIVISNACVVDDSAEDVQVSNYSDFGYGVGLYLVDKICKQQAWLMRVNHENDCFSVFVRLNDSDFSAQPEVD